MLSHPARRNSNVSQPSVSAAVLGSTIRSVLQGRSGGRGSAQLAERFVVLARDLDVRELFGQVGVHLRSL